MSLGSWKINDIIDISATLHNPATGAITDATGSPIWRIYKRGTAAAIRNGTLTKRDSQTGFYTAPETLSVANGYVKGFDYIIKITAVVAGVTGGIDRHFQIEAEVDANVVSDKTGYSLVADPALASICTEARLAELDPANLPVNVDTLLTRLTAARAQVLSDWINGGRLDLLLDAIKAKTDNLPETPKKNTAFVNPYQFFMEDASGNGVPGLTVTGIRILDGIRTAIGAAITEVASSGGFYQITPLAGDTNGDHVTHQFSTVTAGVKDSIVEFWTAT